MEHEDSLTAQRIHDLRRSIDTAAISVAVLVKQAEHTDKQNERIENGVKAIGDDMRSMGNRVSTLETSVAKLEERFQPIQRAVYGMVALVLIAVIGALVAMVVKP